MDKDKILEKSRAAKKDEGKEHLQNLTYRYAYMPIIAVTGFLLGVNYNFPEDLAIFITGLGAIALTATAAECFGRYRFLGKRGFLAACIIAAIAVVVLCGLYVFLNM